jgi:hypothetical protein
LGEFKEDRLAKNAEMTTEIREWPAYRQRAGT